MPLHGSMPAQADLRDASPSDFDYAEAFSRNVGWVTEHEQQVLREKRVAIAGLGGVGGAHLLTLARLGIGAFHISDLDRFELVNFNRQVGATLDAIGRPKVDVLAEMAKAINPELDVTRFPQGIDEENIDAFLDGVDLFVDGFDFFVLDIRAKVFARCAELGIPAITAAPLGMGTAYLIFMPGGMTFEDYFRLEGLSPERRYVNFLIGLNPKGYHRPYLVDPSRVNLADGRGPSTATACQLCAGVVGAEATKILLGRGTVRAAPCYHQFDAYRGKWATGRLRGGNRNPLQALKRHVGYRMFARMSQTARPAESPVQGSEIERILDLARWAPSGDNSQPWRFEITGSDTVTVHVRDQADEDVYDYNGGQPTLLSAGMLLGTMRIAASRHGRMMWWTHRHSSGHDHVIDVQMPRTPGVVADPLIPYVGLRSVDRRRYRTDPLTPEQKQELEAALGEELTIRWHEGLGERLRMARLGAATTDIRLRIPEAFRVHQKILDWGNKFSPDGVPVGAIGLDPLTLKIMRWAMRDWTRMCRLNRMPGATLAARLQMDWLAGLFCAAHFTVVRKGTPGAGDEVPSLLRAGEALQRFWLTATRMGLALQPGMATLIFSHYGRHGVAFTTAADIRRKAQALSSRVDALFPGTTDNLLFAGRIGRPASRSPGPRSLRRPLAKLLSKPAVAAATPPGQAVERASK